MGGQGDSLFRYPVLKEEEKNPPYKNKTPPPPSAYSAGK